MLAAATAWLLAVPARPETGSTPSRRAASRLPLRTTFGTATPGTRTREEKERALAAHAAERRRRDVPLVEDFPLCPEEETPELRDLKMTLQLRSMRAYEHWRGNTHLTLADVIYGLVEQGKLGSVAMTTR